MRKSYDKPYDNLDAEELYHLGLKASEKGDHDEAIMLLKSSLEQQADAKTQYILAAEHAEIGMYDRAIEEMTKALELDPELWTARFQLGLLQMMRQRPEAAIETWAPLIQLDERDPLQQFGAGMSHLMKNQLEAARHCLKKGITINQSNSALNRDMQSVLDNINTELEKLPKVVGGETKTNSQKKHIFLSSYNNKEDS